MLPPEPYASFARAVVVVAGVVLLLWQSSIRFRKNVSTAPSGDCANARKKRYVAM